MENRKYEPKAIISGFRKAAGYEKSDDIAKVLGVTKPTYLKYEKKPWKMTLDTLDKLGELLGEEFIEFFWTHKLYKKD